MNEANGSRNSSSTPTETGIDTQPGLSSYEALRAAKIARNQARLRELGLLRLTPSVTPPPRKRVKVKVALPPPEQLRRSKRLTSRPSSYREPPDVAAPVSRVTSAEEEERSEFPDSTAWRENNEEIETPTGNVLAEDSPLLPASGKYAVRAIGIDCDRLLDRFLGRHMEQTGKAFVIQKSAEHAASIGISDNIHLSFNKYSGVQEWRNLLFLWVNLGQKEGVANDFLDGGRQITWFGGSRMHDQSPVIRRLLQVGRSAARDDDSTESSPFDRCSIVLWCRPYIASKRSFGPYVCLGRLAYHSHSPGSRPLAFVWKLIDYDRLWNHADTTVQQTFRDIMAL